ARLRGVEGPTLGTMIAEAARPLDSFESGFTLPGARPAAARFSPDGARLVTVDDDGARLWSIADGRAVATLPRGGALPPRRRGFSPDGALLLTELRCNPRAASPCVPGVKVWDARDGALRFVLPMGAPLRRARFAGERVIVARTGDRACSFSAATGLPLACADEPVADAWERVDAGGAMTWFEPGDGAAPLDVS